MVKRIGATLLSSDVWNRKTGTNLTESPVAFESVSQEMVVLEERTQRDFKRQVPIKMEGGATPTMTFKVRVRLCGLISDQISPKRNESCKIGYLRPASAQ